MNQTDENRELNVAISLSDEVEKAVREMQQKLSRLGELVYRFEEGCTPHITLYSVEYLEKMEGEVVKEFGRLVAELAPFTIKLSTLAVHPEYAEVMVEDNKQIGELHYQIMKRFNPLRKGYIREKYRDPEFLKDYPLGEHESIQKWGRPIVGEYYLPHISVGRLVKGEIPKDCLSWRAREMRVDTMLLGRGGPWGSVREVVEVGKLE